jgi:hypothetical protein
MTRWMKRLVPLVCVVVLHSTLMERAQADINPRALEDIKAFMKKGESTAMDNKYFDWQDAKHDTARELAAEGVR